MIEIDLAWWLKLIGTLLLGAVGGGLFVLWRLFKDWH
jgi:hypothetical protein